MAQLTEFLLYVKEIHALVADARSARTGRLCTVVFANDISGISQIPDRKFSQALTQSSEQYEKLYPSLAGATMIMNLPFVLQAFRGLFTPLFPFVAGPPWTVRCRLPSPGQARGPDAARRRSVAQGVQGGAQDGTLKK